MATTEFHLLSNDWAGHDIVVVGSGSIGRRHLANLKQLCPSSRITMLCRPASVTETLYSAGADRIVTTIEEVLEIDPSIAIVANPAPLHVPVAQALANIGCHLLVEKPLADQLDGVDRLIETCKSKNLILMVGYCLRFYPSLCEMIHLVNEGKVGRVLHIASEIGQYLPDWRPGSDYRQGVTAQARLGGGALLELSHEIDIALWLGGEVFSVTAELAHVSDLETDVDDCSNMILKYASGARGTIHMDLLQRVPVRRTRVIGSKATIEWDGIADTIHLATHEGGRSQVETTALGNRNNLYLNEMANFLASVAGHEKPVVDGVAAKKVLLVALAAKESAASGMTIKVSSQESNVSYDKIGFSGR